MGFVLAVTIDYNDTRITFAPDVQGPIVNTTLDYLLSCNANALIVGGPPIYLSKWEQSNSEAALHSLSELAKSISILVVDHHLMRSKEWNQWMSPIFNAASNKGNKVLTMAEFANCQVRCMEADRPELYKSAPPSEQFMNWTKATDDYKMQNMPPID
jgi:predicted metallo-beta-lactamase superfamily hydrolase